MLARGKVAGTIGVGRRLVLLILHLLCIPVLAIVLAGGAYYLMPSVPRYGEGRLGDDEITLANALRLDGALWVDARNEVEYVSGHVPGSILLNEEQWSRRIEAFVMRWNGQPVVVYCGGAECNASRAVARRLRADVGVPEIHVLRGGWQGYVQAGRSIEQGVFGR